MDIANDGALLIMSGTVLLILRVPGSDEQKVALKRVNGRLDVSSIEVEHSTINEDAAEKAFLYAKHSSNPIVVLQVLISDLFHWGLNDNILSGPAKMRFVGHVREQLLDKSLETTRMLEEKAKQHGVFLEIKKVETDDFNRASLDEACKNYNKIFIAKEKKKLFPLFEKSMGQYLRKNISIPIES